MRHISNSSHIFWKDIGFGRFTYVLKTIFKKVSNVYYKMAG